MKTWKLIVLMTLPVLLFAAWRIWSIYQERHTPVVISEAPQGPKITRDDLVIPRKMYIDDLKSAKALDGKTVWMQAGYQVEYYPYEGGAIRFGDREGLLAILQEFTIQQVIEVTTPPKWLSSIPRGSRNFFAVFRKPGDPHEYAMPVGAVQEGNDRFYCDDLFFYDNPHMLYSYWPADVWSAIDQHQVKPGMSELEARMALGQVQQTGSSDYGNRTVTYTAGDRKVSVTFVDDKATEVKESKSPA